MPSSDTKHILIVAVIALIWLVIAPTTSAIQNVAFGRVPTYTGSWDFIESASNTVDSNYNTSDFSFYTGVGNSYKTVDFGSNIYIFSINIKSGLVGSQYIDIQTSTDNLNWTARDNTSYVPGCGAGVVSDVNKSISINSVIRYIRINYSSNSACVFSIKDTYEIQAYANFWANESYLYKVDNYIADGQRPYQISLNITNTTGTNNATDIFTQSNCTSVNCSDIKFYLNNVTELPHWVEENISTGVRGRVWVNVTGNGTVSMYYGNGSATASTNGNSTFPQWFGLRTATYLAPLTINFTNKSLEALVRPTNVAHNLRWGLANNIGLTDDYAFIQSVTASNTRFLEIANGGAFSQQSANPSFSSGTSYRLKINNASDGVYGYVDDVQIGSKITTNKPDALMGLFFLISSGTGQQNFSFVRQYVTPEPTWSTWGSQQLLYYNNATNDTQTSISALVNTSVTFYYANASVSWYDNGVLVTANGTTGIYSFLISNITASKTIKAVSGANVTTWTLTPATFPFTLLTPANNTASHSAPHILTWAEWPRNDSYTFYIATDSDFINMVTFGTGSCVVSNCSSPTLTLANSTKYYWKVVNGLFISSPTFDFNTSSGAFVPGSLNISVKDEITFANITGLNVTLYNSTATITQLNTTGYWINFTSANVSAGDYLALVQATGYYSRYYILTSPGTYTLYLPNSSSSISNYTFLLLDYTNDFPFNTTKLIISKFVNSTEIVVSSTFFDVAATTTVTLINGEQYRLSVLNNVTGSIRALGNLIPVAPTTMNLLVSDLEFRPPVNLNNLTQQITYNSNVSIVLTWSDPNNEIIQQNFSIRNTTGSLLYQLVTAVHSGQTTYLMTSNQRLYVCLNTSTVSFGNLSTCNWYNPELPIGEAYTGFDMSISQDAKNFVSMFILFCFAYLYGRRDVTKGALYVSILSILMWITQWLVIANSNTTTAAILIPLFIIAIVSNLAERER